jgi:hypothetical protein
MLPLVVGRVVVWLVAAGLAVGCKEPDAAASGSLGVLQALDGLVGDTRLELMTSSV